MPHFTFHPDLDTLELHVMNRLENEQVEEHLLVCSQCQQVAELLLEEIAVIRCCLAQAA
jgi:uncharacterized CHY-type Zn-finger protein